MNSVDTLQKRLVDAVTTVEKQIESHNRQVEALTKRLEGMKRAAELFESEHAAITELLQAGQADGLGILRMAATPAAQSSSAAAKTAALRARPGPRIRIARPKANAERDTVTARRNGGLTRIDMIAAVLTRHPRRTVQELIALLNKEYRWKTNESAVTGLLYTRRDRFEHIAHDRAAKRPVTWSSK
jgi:hypothetical protein